MADFLTTMYGDGNACIGNKYGKTVVKARDIYFNNDGHMTVIKHSKDFNGTLSDGDCIKLIGISRNTYYKYKRELKVHLTF